VFHAFNRAIEGVTLFETDRDFEQFLSFLRIGMTIFPVRLIAWTVMPNHWHLVPWPSTDDALPAFMRWVTSMHAQAWRRSRATTGRGCVYQGRYKAIAVQTDHHLVRLCAYVERNAARAHLVSRAEDWPWTSASPLCFGLDRPRLSAWPIAKPHDWLARLNAPENPRVLTILRRTIMRNRHFGDPRWRHQAAGDLGWTQGEHPRGRPRSVVPGSSSRILCRTEVKFAPSPLQPCKEPRPWSSERPSL